MWPPQFRHINCGPTHLSGCIGKCNCLAKSWGRLEQGPFQLLWDDAMPCSSCKVTERLPRELASPLNERCFIKNKHNQPFHLPVLNSALLNPVNAVLAEDSKSRRQYISPGLAPCLEQDICRLQRCQGAGHCGVQA